MLIFCFTLIKKMINIYIKALIEYQKMGMNLGEIIHYVRENFTQTEPLPLYDFRIGKTSFQVGPIKFTYNITTESESIEVHEDFRLNFYIDIDEKTSESSPYLEEVGIAYESVAIFMYDKSDIPDFKTEMEEHFKQHLKKLDLSIKENVYDYLLNYYKSMGNDK